MRRTFTFISIFALMISMLALPASAVNGGPSYTEAWDGPGTDSLDCTKDGEGPRDGSWIHWIFSTKGDSTGAELVLGGTGSGTYDPGPPEEAETWHFYTPFFELDGLTATINLFGGQPGTGGGLVISDYCPGDGFGLEGAVTITKTAVPTFTRTHEWDIEKSVTTEKGYKLDDETPKIWLYADERGDEKATWTVDVTYEGFEDTDHALSGSIEVANTGALGARITNLVDTYGGGPVPIGDCKVEEEPFVFGLAGTVLQPGETLVCSYIVAEADKELTENTARVGGRFTDESTFNETDKATYTWDEPTTEHFATVNVKDISDLFGEQTLGTVTEPNDRQFTYDKHFAYMEDFGYDVCGGFTYENTATIVETEQDAEATLKVNVQCVEMESAWAKADESVEGVEDVVSFCEAGFNNWGWTNQIGPGEYEMDLWAGAGQCDTSKGQRVGKVTVTYDEDTGEVEEVFDLNAGLILDGTAFYADYPMFPTTPRGADTTAPGRYYNASPFDGKPIWTIAHANVVIPDPDFGPNG